MRVTTKSIPYARVQKDLFGMDRVRMREETGVMNAILVRKRASSVAISDLRRTCISSTHDK